MSEKVLRICLSELTTVRILCQGQNGRSCSGIVELTIEAMVETYKDQKCPLCGSNITNTSPNYLECLGRSILRLKEQNGLRLEFVIKDQVK